MLTHLQQLPIRRDLVLDLANLVLLEVDHLLVVARLALELHDLRVLRAQDFQEVSVVDRVRPLQQRGPATGKSGRSGIRRPPSGRTHYVCDSMMKYRLVFIHLSFRADTFCD